MKPLKEARLSLRLSQALKEKLSGLEESTGIPATILAVEGLAAICRYYEARGMVTVPFSVIPTPELKALRSRLAEVEAGNARLKKKK